MKIVKDSSRIAMYRERLERFYAERAMLTQERAEASPSDKAACQERINQCDAVISSYVEAIEFCTNCGNEPTQKDFVQINSVVLIKVKLQNRGKSFLQKGKNIVMVTGRRNGDYSLHKIACNSPIGSALMMKRVGEKARCVTPNGKIKLKVLSIYCRFGDVPLESTHYLPKRMFEEIHNDVSVQKIDDPFLQSA